MAKGSIRAAVWQKPGSGLSIERVGLCAPGAGEIEVEVAACAICHSDLAYIDGAWATEGPAVFGHEASGRVVRTGPGVDGVGPGDRVCVTLARSCGTCRDCGLARPIRCDTPLPLDTRTVLTGADEGVIGQGLKTAAFAERVVVHQSQVVPIPATMGWAAASVMSCAVLTGFGAVVRTARVVPGESVAVIGAGGVGLNAVQAARIAGARDIVAVDPSPTRRERAGRFGATADVDPAVGDPVAAVRALSGGRGADKIIVCVGSVPAIETSLGMLARGGTMALAGMPADGALCRFDAGALTSANQSILGSKFGEAVVSEDIPRFCSLHASGELKLDELVTAEVPFDEIDAALDVARSGSGLRTVVTFDWAREARA